MALTIDEKSIIALYADSQKDRDKVILAIQGSLELTDDEEMKELMNSVIRKAKAMSKESFANIDLSDALIYDEHEEQED